MSPKKIGVAGAGQMGQGLAYVCSKFNYPVVLYDISSKVINDALQKIHSLERFDVLMQRQNKSPQALNQNIAQLIEGVTTLEELEACDLIIENIPEKIDLKQTLHEALGKKVSNKAFIGVNTSAIPIQLIAPYYQNPENVVGLHFSNPVNLVRGVELVRHSHGQTSTLATIQDFLSSINMFGIVINDSAGFVSNRVMLAQINEAAYCVSEGVGTARDVDNIFKHCLSHKMGPLETADLIGLDTIVNAMDVIFQIRKEDKFICAPLLRKMVESGNLGRKSGKGFHEY